MALVTVLIILAGWIGVSVLLGIGVGKFIRAGARFDPPTPPHSAGVPADQPLPKEVGLFAPVPPWGPPPICNCGESLDDCMACRRRKKETADDH